MATDMENVGYEQEFVTNSRGMKLFTCSWFPTNMETKALVFLCHGYAMECSISMRDTGIRLAKAGYGVHGMDYQGHGKSSGLAGFIPDFDDLVTDCSHHYTHICEKKENQKKMRILMGESMGGAVVLLLHRKKPDYWDGAILLAPMCKIAEEMRPNPIVMNVLTKLSYLIPTWKIIPTPDVIDAAFRLPQVRNQIRSNPYCYKGRPRLKTGQQLLAVTIDLEKTLQQVALPFYLLHGEADKVTDPGVSRLLYQTASSKDKTLKLYPEMWHSLLYGELPENVDIVFSDVTNWLNQRTDYLTTSRILETQHKHANDDILLDKP